MPITKQFNDNSSFNDSAMSEPHVLLPTPVHVLLKAIVLAQVQAFARDRIFPQKNGLFSGAGITVP